MSSTTVISPWLIGVVVSLAEFTEVLDTCIANVALPHIAGSMGASNDESTWPPSTRAKSPSHSSSSGVDFRRR
jgi:hypothetical protein